MHACANIAAHAHAHPLTQCCVMQTCIHVHAFTHIANAHTQQRKAHDVSHVGCSSPPTSHPRCTFECTMQHSVCDVLERECTDILWSMHFHASRRSDFVCCGARRRFAPARKSCVDVPCRLCLRLDVLVRWSAPYTTLARREVAWRLCG